MVALPVKSRHSSLPPSLIHTLIEKASSFLPCFLVDVRQSSERIAVAKLGSAFTEKACLTAIDWQDEKTLPRVPGWNLKPAKPASRGTVMTQFQHLASPSDCSAVACSMAIKHLKQQPGPNVTGPLPPYGIMLRF